jgi:hypothetical protein
MGVSFGADLLLSRNVLGPTEMNVASARNVVALAEVARKPLLLRYNLTEVISTRNGLATDFLISSEAFALIRIQHFIDWIRQRV